MLRHLLLTLALTAAAPAELTATREGDVVVLRQDGQATLELRPAAGLAVSPSGDTVTISGQAQVELPGFARGLSLYRFKRYWTEPVFASDARKLPRESVMLLWERSGQRGFHVLLPVASGYVYGCGSDPYETLGRAARAALVEGKLRTEKPYPEPLRYLGWCSWNAFYDRVDREKVLAAARALRSAGIPARFILIDDGWMTVSGKKLAGLDAKFPGGLASLTRELKGPLGYRYVGVWHTLQGYWDGTVPGLTPGLVTNNQLTFPDPRGTEFYARWAAFFRGAGVDFVKVDNQAGEARFTDGLMPVAEAGAGAQRALQAAYHNSILNCMEMTPENVYNFSQSNVARSSDDYLPGQNGPRHVFQNAYNAVWLSQFATPDYDMFASGLPDGAYQAVARALSGGPIYCADGPGKASAEVLNRLCYRDGRLLQPDAPGRVAEDLLLVDPTTSPVGLELEAPVERQGYRALLVGCFNVQSAPVRGAVGEQGSACYLWQAGKAVSGVTSVSLPRGGWEMAYVVPLQRGVALFGALDKYLGPVAIQRTAWTGDLLTVELYGGTRFGAYLEQSPAAVTVDGAAARFTFKDHLLVVETPDRDCLINISSRPR